MWGRTVNYPFAAHQDPRLTTWDCTVLAALSAAPQDMQGWSRIGTQTIAGGLGVTETWTKAALKRLALAGWIEVRRQRDPLTGKDLASQRRINWANSLPDEVPGGNEMTTIEPDEDAEGTLLPADFPTPALIAAAADAHKHLPMDDVVKRFREYHELEASRRRSWAKAWLAWLKKAPRDYQNGREHPAGAVHRSHDARERATASRVSEAASRYAVRRADTDGR